MIDFVFLTVVKFVLLQGIGTLHPSAAVPPPRASHDRGWIGILLGILAVLVLIIILIVLLFYLRYVITFLMEMYGNALPLPFERDFTPCHIPFCYILQGCNLTCYTIMTVKSNVVVSCHAM